MYVLSLINPTLNGIFDRKRHRLGTLKDDIIRAVDGQGLATDVVRCRRLCAFDKTRATRRRGDVQVAVNLHE